MNEVKKMDILAQADKNAFSINTSLPEIAQMPWDKPGIWNDWGIGMIEKFGMNKPLATKPLGQTELRVSPFGLGTVKFGRDQQVKYHSYPIRVIVHADSRFSSYDQKSGYHL